jgi:hypothetical protein
MPPALCRRAVAALIEQAEATLPAPMGGGCGVLSSRRQGVGRAQRCEDFRSWLMAAMR